MVAPVVMVNSTTSTSILLFWSSSRPEVDGYVVAWEKNTPLECPGRDKVNMTINNSSTSYNITHLEEGSRYTISVMAFNAAGIAVSDPFIGITKEAGELIMVW